MNRPEFDREIKPVFLAHQADLKDRRSEPRPRRILELWAMLRNYFNTDDSARLARELDAYLHDRLQLT